MPSKLGLHFGEVVRYQSRKFKAAEWSVRWRRRFRIRPRRVTINSSAPQKSFELVFSASNGSAIVFAASR